MAAEGRIVREGIVAGLIGAAAVAVLILIFDIASGAPLQSPAILGSAILKGIRDPSLVTVSAGPVLGYTILHGLGFIAVGLIAAFLVASAEREPAMVLALLIFFAAFEVFFLALIAFWALPVLGVLAWWEILAGNLVASAAMLYYFHRCHPGLARSLIGRWVDVVREGIMAGFLGGSVVAVWFLLYDAIRLRPLHTPALLGAAVLQGLRDPGSPHPPTGRRRRVHHLPLRRLRLLRDRRRRVPPRRRARAADPARPLHPLPLLPGLLLRVPPGARRPSGGRAPLVERGDREPPRVGGHDHLLLPRPPLAGHAAPGALDRGGLSRTPLGHASPRARVPAWRTGEGGPAGPGRRPPAGSGQK